MNLAFREHERAARIIAKELEDEGYAVFVEPTPDQIPFSLEGYAPDLLATKADDNMIIEIKSRRSPELLERYRKVIDIIQAHPGWKFFVRTISDASGMEEVAATGVPDMEVINRYLEKAKKVASSGAPELAVPYLWNVMIAMLRNKAVMVAPEVHELPDRSLVNQLYSLGEISTEQHESLRKWYELRNKAVHDLDFAADSKEVEAMLVFAQMLFSEIGH